MRKNIALFVVFTMLLMLIPIPALAADSVKNVTVAVYPLTPNTASQYTIGFYTSSMGELDGGKGEIYITFPEGTTIPANIDSDTIIVNGESMSSSDLDTDEDVLTIELPSDLDIPASGYVGITITTEAGIMTPARAGSQYIKISTNRDNTGTSNEFSLDGTKITDLEVAVSPGTVDEYASYQISFETSSKGALSGGEDYIYIEFPEEVDLPKSISSKYITVNVEKAGNVDVDRDKGLVAIRLPDGLDITKKSVVEVEISEDAHIRNPEDEGDYELRVYTSKDAYYRAEDYSVGVTVTAPVVLVNPAETGETGQYSIGFTTSSDGALDSGDYIYLYFPEETSLTSGVSKSDITINGYKAASVSVDRGDDTISVKLPSDLSIGNDAYVGIVVKNDAGVKNPSKSGKYRLGVATSSDKSKVYSQEYSIKGSSSGDGEMDINFSTYEAGEIAEINIMVEAGSFGELEEGDELTLDLANDFDLPASIDASDITVNGEEVAECKISGNDLEITLAEDIDEDDDIEIIINENAEIQNPEDEGDYEIELSSSNTSLSIEIEIGNTEKKIPEVKLSNSEAGEESQYTISFVTESDDEWDEGDLLAIRFPSGTSLPSSIDPENIIVGSVEAERVDVSGTRLKIYLADDMFIDEDDEIVIIIPEYVGIKNPATGGSYTLTLELPDDSELESEAYTIEGDGVVEDDEEDDEEDETPAQTGKNIVFRIGSKLLNDGGVLINMTTAPTIIDNVTFVPLRALGDVLGAETAYDGEARTITVKYNGQEIVFIVDSRLVKLNNQWVALDVPVSLVNNSAMIPVRFVSQSFGATVEWKEETQEIIINK